MTKYTTIFKIDAVQRYFNENISLKALAIELHLPDTSMLGKWINTAQKQGISASEVKHHQNHYVLDFKLKVVEYYQTHDT